MEDNKNKKLLCCFCGKEITEEDSFSPYPVSTVSSARCCSECHISKVIPERLDRSALAKFD